jgi:hypothetical protein
MMTSMPIPAFTRYEISVNGRVRNIKTGRFLKTSLATGGYPKLNLRNDHGRSATVFVNAAVLTAFVGKIPDNATFLYRDGSRQNVGLYNLGWETPKERTLIVQGIDGKPKLVTLPTVLSGRFKPSTVCRGMVVNGRRLKGHPLSIDGNEDENTLTWGYGNRVCRMCDAPHGLPEPAQVYSLHFGVGLPCSSIATSPDITFQEAA